jgi:uncharacterized integral membrane protein (TIGR00698 family)
MELVHLLPPSPLLSDVLLAMLLGVLIVNTPMRRVLGVLVHSNPELPDRYGRGISFTCNRLLRLAIILMGLKVDTSVIGGSDLLLVLAICGISIPATFFVTHLLGAALSVPRAMVDLLASGSMICGASAVYATAPIVGAEKKDQGLAVAVVFLSSIAAMLSFRAIAQLVALPADAAGLWAGLAVNDLSTAVAVGAQMGGPAAVLAAAAKSTRILMLAPVLISLSWLRRDRTSTSKPRINGTLRSSIVANLPRFILGYVALALVRAAGDHVFGSAPHWRWLLSANHIVVAMLMAMVSAGIGLHLSLRSIVSSSTGALLTSLGASAFMAAFTLTLLTAATQNAFTFATGTGVTTLMFTYGLYRISTRASDHRLAVSSPRPTNHQPPRDP